MNVFNGQEAYAICLKTDNKAIGAIELKLNGHTDMTERDDECELGYWLGKPFWGQGIVPEAAARGWLIWESDLWYTLHVVTEGLPFGTMITRSTN